MARILIIDDHRLVRDTLVLLLKRESHEIQEAANGREALRLCEDNPPELVITDILMPGVDGFEVIRRMRQLSPRPKIIALSGGGRNPSQDVLKKAAHIGADQTFSKPIEIAEFVAAVTDLLATA